MKSELPKIIGAALLGIAIALAITGLIIGGFIWIHTHFMRP